MMRQGWLGVVFALTVCAPAVASAQDGAERRPLVLVTEQIERAEAQPQVSYWWASGSGTQPTGTDDALFAALAERGVTPTTLAPGQKMSRVYRAPHLSRSNGAALAGLLGVPRAVVGAALYEVLPATSPFGQVGVRVSASVALLDASGGDERELATSRVVWASGERAALELARAQAGASLGRLVARALAADDGPVGVEAAEPFLVLSGMADQEALRRSEAALAAAPGISAVRVRWVAEGRVAYEINPGVEDTREVIAGAARALEAHAFATFSWREDAQASSPSALVLRAGSPRPAEGAP
jgi:hypothetical protein